MPKGISEGLQVAFAPGKMVFEGVKDAFSPDFPEPQKPETPDPVAQQATLPAAQAQERSLINKAGLQTTKKVQQSLLRQEGRQTLGGTVV